MFDENCDAFLFCRQVSSAAARGEEGSRLVSVQCRVPHPCQARRAQACKARQRDAILLVRLALPPCARAHGQAPLCAAAPRVLQCEYEWVGRGCVPRRVEGKQNMGGWACAHRGWRPTWCPGPRARAGRRAQSCGRSCRPRACCRTAPRCPSAAGSAARALRQHRNARPPTQLASRRPRAELPVPRALVWGVRSKSATVDRGSKPTSEGAREGGAATASTLARVAILLRS